jgi:hypothetical protein
MSDLTEFEQQIVANVEQYGCHIMHVFDPDGVEENFSYSIGFPVSVSQSDVIVFGLDQKLMHSMINEMHRQCREGLAMQDGLRVSDLLEGFDCELRSVRPENLVAEYFGSAMWYLRIQTGHKLTGAFQIVWPGSVNGLFPWDEGVSQDVIDAQPALYEAVA